MKKPTIISIRGLTLLLTISLAIQVIYAQPKHIYRHHIFELFTIDVIDSWQVLDKAEINDPNRQSPLDLVSPVYIQALGLTLESLKNMEMLAIMNTLDPTVFRDSMNIRRVFTRGVKVTPEMLIHQVKEGITGFGGEVYETRILLAEKGRQYLYVSAKVSIPLKNGISIIAVEHQYSYFGQDSIWIITFATTTDRISVLATAFEHMALSFQERN